VRTLTQENNRLNITIRPASADDADILALLITELLAEITRAVASPVFNAGHEQMASAAHELLSRGMYYAFLATDAGHGEALGVITLYESHALYTLGSFGTIAEFYVRERYRSQGIGRQLLANVDSFARSRTWTRVEVTTPPLPLFYRSLRFYEQQGFSVTGGRKLKRLL